MARIVTKTAHAPFILEPQDKPVKICMCGLSSNQPFCNGTHLKTVDEEEGKTYIYDEKGNRKEMKDCCKGEKDCVCNDEGCCCDESGCTCG